MSNQPGRQRKARMSLVPTVAQGAGLYAKCITDLDRELSRNSRTKRGVITVAGPRKTTQYGSAWIPGMAGSAVTCVTFQIRKRSESHSGSQCCSGSSPSRSSRTSPSRKTPTRKWRRWGGRSGWLFNSTVQQQQPGESAVAAAATVTHSDVSHREIEKPGRPRRSKHRCSSKRKTLERLGTGAVCSCSTVKLHEAVYEHGELRARARKFEPGTLLRRLPRCARSK